MEYFVDFNANDFTVIKKLLFENCQNIVDKGIAILSYLCSSLKSLLFNLLGSIQSNYNQLVEYGVAFFNQELKTKGVEFIVVIISSALLLILLLLVVLIVLLVVIFNQRQYIKTIENSNLEYKKKMNLKYKKKEKDLEKQWEDRIKMAQYDYQSKLTKQQREYEKKARKDELLNNFARSLPKIVEIFMKK